ncbi:hypothetical protein NADFUDRAFT_52699 [Nadsonia fulvescens var. elongata DSM 6958]|uniref:Uncharacterized protein n=1 Tax=Nadsonia fulvescens var. elongata DSM 6958 TaxID=857566 RepID=A0A1E3PGC4_9ASCO|nr:hypothetical protein NADFUDRAFT_52699 [Nadsonia fulvescens var. elongata DSM 6958]
MFEKIDNLLNKILAWRNNILDDLKSMRCVELNYNGTLLLNAFAIEILLLRMKLRPACSSLLNAQQLKTVLFTSIGMDKFVKDVLDFKKNGSEDLEGQKYNEVDPDWQNVVGKNDSEKDSHQSNSLEVGYNESNGHTSEVGSNNSTAYLQFNLNHLLESDINMWLSEL